jgi:hypothetical protein
MTTFSPPGRRCPEAKTLFPKDLARMMAAGHPALLRRDGERRLPDRPDEQGAPRLEPQGRRVPDGLHAVPEGLRLRDAADRSISAGSSSSAACIRSGTWDPQKREYDYSFKPAVMRPVAEYLKLQGTVRPPARRAHRHAAAVRERAVADDGTSRLPEALVRAADPTTHLNMATAEAACRDCAHGVTAMAEREAAS